MDKHAQKKIPSIQHTNEHQSYLTFIDDFPIAMDHPTQPSPYHPQPASAG
jgi:hypothetical protein